MNKCPKNQLSDRITTSRWRDGITWAKALLFAK